MLNLTSRTCKAVTGAAAALRFGGWDDASEEAGFSDEAFEVRVDCRDFQVHNDWTTSRAGYLQNPLSLNLGVIS